MACFFPNSGRLPFVANIALRRFRRQTPNPADLTHTLPAVWEKHWAYLQQDGIAPVIVGEFGGPSMGQDTEGV